MIRVLIAEDQAMIRGALAALLSDEPDIEVVAQVERGDQVLVAAVEAKPDVALLDIEMPGCDGIAAAADLQRHLPSCRTLILTVFGRPGYLRRAVESGVRGFLLKDAPPDELAVAVRRVMAGEKVFDPKLAISALSDGTSPLTPREQEVLSLSADGASVEAVASALHLSSGTVRNHLSIAIQKVNAHNRIEAARIAREKGWL
ncbi:MAG TPA: response regulator transcription factor [Terriglobales bacterium]|nr:response regulator transcription factor [Terriglobales bacterium]